MKTTRLEAFSDGVLAIIITIMVLELKVPHAVELAALKPLLPVLLSYVLSFIYLGIYWNNHHHLFQATEQVSGGKAAPGYFMAKRIIKLIKRETAHAKAGRPGRIIVKINSLTDVEIIRALYAASQAGVSIDLIVRGVCMLRPNLPQVSNNIRVRSLVGRFLEHSRIFYFANNGKEEVFIGSADWMYRNMSRRVEVLTPIKDAQLKTFLKDKLLHAYLKDNVNTRELRSDGTYTRVKIPEGEKRFDCQLEFEGTEFGPPRRDEGKSSAKLQSVTPSSKKFIHSPVILMSSHFTSI